MTPQEEAEYKRIQRQRARITAILLIAFAALIFGITIAKIGLFA